LFCNKGGRRKEYQFQFPILSAACSGLVPPRLNDAVGQALTEKVVIKHFYFFKGGTKGGLESGNLLQNKTFQCRYSPEEPTKKIQTKPS
jgi:hypothetical protein